MSSLKAKAKELQSKDTEIKVMKKSFVKPHMTKTKQGKIVPRKGFERKDRPKYAEDIWPQPGKGGWLKEKDTFVKDKRGVLHNIKYLDPQKLKQGLFLGEYEPAKYSHEKRFAKSFIKPHMTKTKLGRIVPVVGFERKQERIRRWTEEFSQGVKELKGFYEKAPQEDKKFWRGELDVATNALSNWKSGEYEMAHQQIQGMEPESREFLPQSVVGYLKGRVVKHLIYIENLNKGAATCPYDGKSAVQLRRYYQAPYWIREFKCKSGHVFQVQG
jgi:hypothetical protein